MLRQYKTLKSLIKGKNIPNPQSLLKLNLNRMKISAKYTPSKIKNHPVFLFKAKDLPREYQDINHPNNYWDAYIDKLKVYHVPGSHETLLLPPNVTKLATLLESVLINTYANG